MSKRYDIGSCSIKYKSSKNVLKTAPIRKENEIIILIPFMKDLSNPLEYGAPFQAILRDYFSKIQIENYKIKPYFIVGNVEKQKYHTLGTQEILLEKFSRNAPHS